MKKKKMKKMMKKMRKKQRTEKEKEKEEEIKAKKIRFLNHHSSLEETNTQALQNKPNKQTENNSEKK